MDRVRRVRRLHLEAEEESLLGRGQTLVEDALRTASLPDADGGRLYLVRRLQLGVIDPARPPGVVAQAIERRFADLRAAAVHAAAPAAWASTAVYFEDALEPFTILVRRIAAGPLPAEWFWPLAVRGYRPNLPRDYALRAAVTGALTAPGRAAAVAALLASLNDVEIQAVCEVLQKEDGAALLGALPAAPSVSLSPPVSPWLPARWRNVVERWLRRWGGDDPRTLWLAATAICAGAPARASGAGILAQAASLIEDVEREAAPDEATFELDARPPVAAREKAVTETEASTLVRATSTEAPVARSSIERGSVEPPPRAIAEKTAPAEPAPAEPHRERTPVTQAGSPVAREESSAPASSPSTADVATKHADVEPVVAAGPARSRRLEWEGKLLPTTAGGLLFLLRPLARIGFPAWLDAEPAAADARLGERLLRLLALRAGIATDDAALAPWSDDDLPPVSIAHEQALRDWRTRLSRWTRRRARLSLEEIVTRPAWIVSTRTHVDVIFAARDADLRVRAAGLDADPGWVPWLGRVVQFHYREEVPR